MRFDTVMILVLIMGAFSLKAMGNSCTQAIEVGNDKQLFIDDKFIETAKDIELTVNTPQVAGIAIPADQPWEQGCLSASCVIQTEEKIQMYYGSWPWNAASPYSDAKFCYAESKDGIVWTKPILNKRQYLESTENNILSNLDVDTGGSEDGGGNVFIDPQAPPDKRYKMLALAYNWKELDKAGLYLYCSPDGINWTFNPVRVFPFMPDGINQIVYNNENSKYHAYFRQWFPRSAGTIYTSMIKPLRTVGMVIVDDPMEPWPYNKKIAPFHLWGKDYLPTPSAEFAVALQCDQQDPPETDLYTGCIEKYKYAPGIWLAFPFPAFRHSPDDGLKFLNDGLLDIQLAVSRDGINWKRYRQPYIRLGHANIDEPCYQLYMGLGTVRNGNQIFLYYNSWQITHHSDDKPKKLQWGKCYRAVQRLDGFVSADASYRGGEFTTPKIKFTGSHLKLNVDTSALGQAQVEILNENGCPIKGYSLQNAELIQGNFIDKTVRWSGTSDLSALAGKVIKLRFVMNNAKLYTFQFTN